MKQIDLIHNEEWDILFILDACRYDYFESEYEDYFEGELIKTISPSTKTVYWLQETWNGYYEDIVYFSGNPFINSLGVDSFGFEPTETFGGIVDLWDEAYDGNLINSKKLLGLVDERISEYEDKRWVIHLVQPHTPFHSMPEFWDKTMTLPQESSYQRLKHRIIDYLTNIIPFRFLRRFLGLFRDLRHTTNYPEIIEKYSEEGLKEGYRENVRFVLEAIYDFLRKYRKRDWKVILTADHGELLGEDGLFGHPLAKRSELKEIPWFRLEKVR